MNKQIFWAMLVVLLSITSGFFQKVLAQSSFQPSFYGLPARLRDLTDLDLSKYSNALNPQQQTEVLLSWLAQEHATPSAISMGYGGSPIDSAYIQAQIVIALASEGDPYAVAAVAYSSQDVDPFMRRTMHLVLGCMGDVSETPLLLQTLSSHPNPFFREIAAGFLGLLGSTQSLAALKQARQDTYLTDYMTQLSGKPDTFNALKNAAEGSLRVLQDPNRLIQSQQRSLDFALTYAGEQQEARANHLSPARFIAVANSGRNEAAKRKVAGRSRP